MRQELLEILEVVREEEREILEEGAGIRKDLYTEGDPFIVTAQDDGRRPEADPDQDAYEIYCIPAPPPRFY